MRQATHCLQVTGVALCTVGAGAAVVQSETPLERDVTHACTEFAHVEPVSPSHGGAFTVLVNYSAHSVRVNSPHYYSECVRVMIAFDPPCIECFANSPRHELLRLRDALVPIARGVTW
jgi:hypothetical protein